MSLDLMENIKASVPEMLQNLFSPLLFIIFAQCIRISRCFDYFYFSECIKHSHRCNSRVMNMFHKFIFIISKTGDSCHKGFFSVKEANVTQMRVMSVVLHHGLV